MSVRSFTPEESAASARKGLVKAMQALAEAQLAVSQAMQTVGMFEHNFRLGYYQQKEFDSTFTTSSVLHEGDDGDE